MEFENPVDRPLVWCLMTSDSRPPLEFTGVTEPGIVLKKYYYIQTPMTQKFPAYIFYSSAKLIPLRMIFTLRWQCAAEYDMLSNGNTVLG